MSNIIIIDYGAGNVFSVAFAIERLGYRAVLSADFDQIKRADKVIFPGVGSAGYAMRFLRKKGLDTLIPNLTQPVLGICLGLQLMCRHSEEEDTNCLGIFPLDVSHFPKGKKVPHIGWNEISNADSPVFQRMPNRNFVYFVHSYYAPVDERYTIATSDYGVTFSAALQKDNFFACQFHPEKSGTEGQFILKNFLEL